jgi:excisionase family DNA binding protein
MGRSKPVKDLFTASQLAHFCQVDLKTIHNWADRGEIEHFRTPGRHLRFRAPDVLDFLRRYGYPIPGVLSEGRPTVVVLLEDAEARTGICEALEVRFEVHLASDPLSALIELGAETPDAIVIGSELAEVQACRMVEALKTAGVTARVRAVVCGSDEASAQRAHKAGASAFVDASDRQAVVATLSALLGLDRGSGEA